MSWRPGNINRLNPLIPCRSGTGCARQTDLNQRVIQQAGIALITVLLVLALASMTAVSLLERQQLDVRRTTVLAHQQQARLYLHGAEQWAAQRLAQDRRDSETDHLDEDWATALPSLPVTGGWVQGQLTDLQGRFNVNNLIQGGEVDATQQAVLQRLFDRLSLDSDGVNALLDWLDADQEPRFPGGAEDSYYRTLDPSYLAANRPLLSLTELRLVRGFDPDTWVLLQPLLSALPEPTPLNVNTAPAELLAALDPRLDDTLVERLLDARQEHPFSDGADFITATGLEDFAMPAEQLSGRSDYFLLQARARVGEGQARLFSVLQRSESGLTRSLLRSYGEDG